MTVKEKLLEEFKAAINAVLGDVADQDIKEVELDSLDVRAICNKVVFYMDL